jgi:hypothetical protein
MYPTSRWWGVVAVSILLLTPAIHLDAAPGRKQTFTGEVGDAMCGRKHMDGTPAECTRSCVSHGSKFALVVGERIYILDTSDQKALAVLDKQAGKNATVVGVLNGDTIEVKTVTPK